MFIDRAYIFLIQVGDLRLRQPDRLVLQSTLDTRAPILCLIEDDFGLGQCVITHLVGISRICADNGLSAYCIGPATPIGGLLERQRFSNAEVTLAANQPNFRLIQYSLHKSTSIL